jgi:hypothetical protein
MDGAAQSGFSMLVCRFFAVCLIAETRFGFNAALDRATIQ